MTTTYFGTQTTTSPSTSVAAAAMAALGLSSPNVANGDFTLPQAAPSTAGTGVGYNANTSSSRFFAFVAAASDPGSSFATGDHTFEFDVTSGSTSLFLSVSLARVDSTGSSILSQSAYSAEQTASAGVKTFSFTAVNLGTPGATDRFAIIVRERNSSSMSSNSMQFQVGALGAGVDDVAPWSPAAADTLFAQAAL